jgi:hypothetical protein
MWVTQCILVRVGRENIDALFFMLEWPDCGFRKKRSQTRWTKLVFLHPVGSTG